MKLPRLVLSCILAFCGVALAADPAALPRSTPEAQGVSSAAVLDFVAAAEAKIDALHSVMVLRHGQVIAEGWWAPYAAELPHQMYSLSKSFTSTAVGLAIAEGKFTVDDPVLDFFPAEAPAKPSANLKAMRVRDLLTMSTGHHAEDIQNFPYTAEESLVKTFLALPVTHKPGTLFVYNTPATYMLSAIVQKTTGQTVLDYLRPRLFAPLGIAAPTWEASKQGISMGGYGLSIRTEDIARFGQLYLQRGQWQGRQLVPAAWIDTATSRWVSNGSNPASDWDQGYGFQFWRCRHGVYRGDGAHGQFCIVLPEYDAVIAMTSGTRDLQGVLNVVWEKLLPALQQSKAAALPAAPAAQEQLRRKLAGLTLRHPAAVETPALAQAIAGRRYVFPSVPSAGASLTYAPLPAPEALTVNPLPEKGAVELVLQLAGSEYRLKSIPGVWQYGELTMGGQVVPVATSGAWTAPDTYTLEVVRTHTPFTAQARMVFKDTQVVVTVEPKVGPRAGPVLLGRQE